MSNIRVKWNCDEDEILKEYYSVLGARGCRERGLNRSVCSIKNRASLLGIKYKREVSNNTPVVHRWTTKERDIMRKHFKSEGIKGVLERGVKKSPSLIYLEASKMHLFD